MKCPVEDCNVVTVDAEDMDAHLSNHHNRSHCFVCDRSFTAYRHRRTRDEHVMNMHEGVRYQCTNCDAEFSGRGATYNHIKKRCPHGTVYHHKLLEKYSTKTPIGET